MSSWQLIEWLYPLEEICPGRMWEDIIHLPTDTIARYRAFRGHFLAYLEPYLGRAIQTFTVLRDPVERTVSHYYHVKRSPEHPYYAHANSMSLAEFCLHPATRHMVENYQAGYLACPGGKNPVKIAADLTSEDLRQYRLQLTLDPAPAEFPPADELYQAASERLRSFIAVGITERLQESLGLIARRLGAGTPPPGFARRNVADNRPSTVDAETLDVIRQKTVVDSLLYSRQAEELEATLETELEVG